MGVILEKKKRKVQECRGREFAAKLGEFDYSKQFLASSKAPMRFVAQKSKVEKVCGSKAQSFKKDKSVARSLT